jgi:lysophospholipase L1-like esterase
MRARWAFAVAASTVCLGLTGAGSAGAAVRPITKPSVAPGFRYLALGDSITFGYRESTTVPAPNYNNPSSFIGYPQLVGAALRLKVTNAACPGETTSSLITPSAPSNGCENHPPPITTPTEMYRADFPLHVNYKGSQLAFAVKYLRSHRNVRLVSLLIGANDLLRCVETTSDACASAVEAQAVLSVVRSNVRTILSTIRHKAGYRGQLVILTQYSPNYTSAFLTNGVSALNNTVEAAAKPFRVLTANGFGQFYQGSLYSAANPCTAGLLTQLKPSGCGVHPSYGGQSLLALAVERAIHH